MRLGGAKRGGALLRLEYEPIHTRIQKRETHIHIVFDTKSVRLSDRIEYWRDTICHNLIGVRCQGASWANFEGRVSVLGGERGALAQISAGPHVAWTSSEVPREKGFYYLFVQREGQLNLRRDEGDFTLLPGDLYLHDAETEHQFHFPENFEHLALRIPSALARKHWPGLHNVQFMLHDGRNQPVNRLISALASELMENAEDLLEAEVSASVMAAFDIFVQSVNAREPQHFGGLPTPVKLLRRAKQHISAHLSDATLTPDRVAQELGVSRRYLDVLFGRDGKTASGHIQDLRLSRCAAELRSNRAHPRQISNIAYDWGFRDASSFSRAFRQKYGCSPKGYRAGRAFH